MRRPSFQFYPADWRNNANLRRCSPAARGIWIDIMCVLHDSDEYGVVRWPLADLSNAANAPIKMVRELVEKGVLKGHDKYVETPFIYTPRSGRKDGQPVTLIAAQAGPCWYSSRMVKDEYVRVNAGAATRFSPVEARTPTAPYDAPGQAFNHGEIDTMPDDLGASNPSPTHRHGEDQGDGSTSSSASTTTLNTSVPIGTGAAGVGRECFDRARRMPPCQTESIVDLYHEILPNLPAVRVLDAARQKAISARWKWVLTEKKRSGDRYATTTDEALDWFRRYFEHATGNDFIMGRGNKSTGHQNWRADIEYLMSERGLKQVIEKTLEAA